MVFAKISAASVPLSWTLAALLPVFRFQCPVFPDIDDAIIEKLFRPGRVQILFESAVRNANFDVRAFIQHVAIVFDLQRKAVPDGELARFCVLPAEFGSVLSEGKETAEIADRLCLGTETIKWYRKRLRAKFGVTSSAAVVAEAIRRGMI